MAELDIIFTNKKNLTAVVDCQCEFGYILIKITNTDQKLAHPGPKSDGYGFERTMELKVACNDELKSFFGMLQEELGQPPAANPKKVRLRLPKVTTAKDPKTGVKIQVHHTREVSVETASSGVGEPPEYRIKVDVSTRVPGSKKKPSHREWGSAVMTREEALALVQYIGMAIAMCCDCLLPGCKLEEASLRSPYFADNPEYRNLEKALEQDEEKASNSKKKPH